MLVKVIKDKDLIVDGKECKIGDKLNLTDDLAQRLQKNGVVTIISTPSVPKVKQNMFYGKSKKEVSEDA